MPPQVPGSMRSTRLREQARSRAQQRPATGTQKGQRWGMSLDEPGHHYLDAAKGAAVWTPANPMGFSLGRIRDRCCPPFRWSRCFALPRERESVDCARRGLRCSHGDGQHHSGTSVGPFAGRTPKRARSVGGIDSWASVRDVSRAAATCLPRPGSILVHSRSQTGATRGNQRRPSSRHEEPTYYRQP
jgi:hypothetical protein